MADPEEKRQFDEALASCAAATSTRRSLMFGAFVRRYPGSGYADSARFWLGNALYGKRDYKEAITVVPHHGQQRARPSARARGAAGDRQLPGRESRDSKAARATIGELIKVYPKSEAAQAGRERLAALK